MKFADDFEIRGFNTRDGGVLFVALDKPHNEIDDADRVEDDEENNLPRFELFHFVPPM